MIRSVVKLRILTTGQKVSVPKRKASTERLLSKDIYNVKRGNFTPLNDGHVQYFKGLLGEARINTNENDLQKYNEDWFGYAKGISKLVVKPKTTEEVSKILKFCNENRLAVCPQGGNTSVVASGVPVFDEIVMSMELMNNIESIDDVSGILVCQAGCILENLNNTLAEKGLMMPQDMGSKGSCQVGGNLAANAGGLRLLRYGNLHGNVLGVEAVKADGEVLDVLSTLKKDNTGYHLKHLFIGSEGTLGIITKVAIQCPTRPKCQNVAFLGLESYEKVLETYKQAKFNLGEILSAVEVMDTPSMELAKEKLNKTSPIGEYPFYLLIETSGSNEEHDAQKLTSFLDFALEKQLVLNGTVATEPSKCREIWEIRERLPDAYSKDGYVFCYDFSLPLSRFFTVVDIMKKHMGPHSHRVFGFGHLGDSNLHLQISIKEFTKEIKDMVEPFVFEKVKELNGSISAEHGMGFLKAKYLDMVNQPAAVKLMKDLKEVMDPNGILNPYKVIP